LVRLVGEEGRVTEREGEGGTDGCAVALLHKRMR
jgi:hypothetical protein